MQKKILKYLNFDDELKLRQCERIFFRIFVFCKFRLSVYSVYTKIDKTGKYLKHVLFCVFRMYGNYLALIGSKFLQNNCFDSVLNQIFDYVHGTHCLN